MSLPTTLTSHRMKALWSPFALWRTGIFSYYPKILCKHSLTYFSSAKLSPSTHTSANKYRTPLSTKMATLLPFTHLGKISEMLPTWLTRDIYGTVLFWKHSNTILTHNQCTIEVCSSIDCCSWCNGSCHHLCDSEVKWPVRNYPTKVTRKKRLSDVKGWDPPLVSNRQNCTSECHTLPGTRPLHTGLQLSTWIWKSTILQLKEQYMQSGVQVLSMYDRSKSSETYWFPARFYSFLHILGSCPCMHALKVGQPWITNLRVMWTDEWASSYKQDSQKVCTKLLSQPDTV